MAVSVERVGDGVFDVSVGGKKVRMDSSGNEAASPAGMFLASFAACIAVYAESYCRNAGINTEGMKVEFDYERLQNPGRFAKMKAKITIPNADFKGREKAIIRAAEQCLVHETIKEFKGIEITLGK
ncbi:MAG: OsmC family protein [Candidatus Altiarchaeota archaeon]|nr:OsmC family protein [Candidatus Altiarchaeota archaeon]